LQTKEKEVLLDGVAIGVRGVKKKRKKRTRLLTFFFSAIQFFIVGSYNRYKSSESFI